MLSSAIPTSHRGRTCLLFKLGILWVKDACDLGFREYINEWRKQRAKEEEELKRLKEKQAKRKEIR